MPAPFFRHSNALTVAATIALALPAIATAVHRLHTFDVSAAQTASATPELTREIHADMDFLASDELHGRGSATRDEHLAALFAAAQFQTLGLEPGGNNGTYIQRATLPNPLPARLQKYLQRNEATPRKETWNAIAILRGTSAPNEVILLTAHLDHLGMLAAATAPAGTSAAAGTQDLIYNGADDDASGTTAVLTLAHMLATGKRPRRTIVFALFGSEEIGGFGNRAFLDHPPVPLANIVANLEFEMIGRADPAAGKDSRTLWLTGYERSNLGPELAKHGAPLVQDPHPTEKFFERSDNIALARQGIIAQTVSSFGLHKDYHQVSDEIRTIDFDHLSGAIAGMAGPVRWLADSDFKPQWNPGGRPQPRQQ
jgi:Peptidase family M28